MATGKIDKPEMIFALVGPAGVRLNDLSKVLTEQLKLFGYTAEVIPYIPAVEKLPRIR